MNSNESHQRGKSRRGAALAAFGLIAVVALSPVAINLAQTNADSLNQLRQAHCLQFDTKVIEDFENRTEPVFEQDESRGAQRQFARRVVAISPPALEGRQFERFSAKYRDVLPDTLDTWSMKVDVPLDRETHVAWAMRTNVRPPMTIRVLFPDGRTGTMFVNTNEKSEVINLADQVLGSIDARARMDERLKGWRVAVSPDVLGWASELAAKNNMKLEGAKIVSIGFSAAVAEDVSVDFDQITLWQRRSCEGVPTPVVTAIPRATWTPQPTVDPCVPDSYAMRVLQDFESATTPLIRNVQTRNAVRGSLKQAITTAADSYLGERAERLQIEYNDLPRGSYDMWGFPANLPLSGHTWMAVAYKGNRPPQLQVSFQYQNRGSSEYQGVTVQSPLAQTREYQVADKPDWKIAYTADLYDFAVDIAKRQGWSQNNIRISAYGLAPTDGAAADFTLDQFTLWTKKNECP